MSPDKEELSAYFKMLGAKGGKARKQRMSKEQRSAQARKAAIARWRARKDTKK